MLRIGVVGSVRRRHLRTEAEQGAQAPGPELREAWHCHLPCPTGEGRMQSANPHLKNGLFWLTVGFFFFFSKEKGYGSFMKQGCKIEGFLFSSRREGMGMSLPCRVCKCSPSGWAAQRVPWQKTTHAGMLGRARTAEDRNLSAYP